MIGVGQIATSLLLEIHRIGLPMVLVDHEDNLIPSDTIFANNVDGTYRMVNHLIGLGHKELYFLGNMNFSRSFRDRWLGFRSALEENGLDAQLHNDPMLFLESIETGGFNEALKDWLQARKQSKTLTLPTALVCANDSVAIHTVEILKGMGIRVPEDVTVTGFDNIEDAARFEPAITTVNVPKEQLGRRAVTKLLDRLNDANRAVEKLLITVELLYRNSASKPREEAEA
ncbi:HTH-type transcriptional regulator DegA [compost metagenome]